MKQKGIQRERKKKKATHSMSREREREREEGRKEGKEPVYCTPPLIFMIQAVLCKTNILKLHVFSYAFIELQRGYHEKQPASSPP